MEILGTFIADEEIIGISSIAKKTNNLYYTTLSFSVIVKQSSVPIQSDQLSAIEGEREFKKRFLEFQMSYIKAYKAIFEMRNSSDFKFKGEATDKEWNYPKYITEMEKEVKQLWIELKLDQQTREN